MIDKFPYPAKQPGGCRFPASGDNANFQEYGEEPVVMSEADFQSWWFFYEDPEKPCMSHVGMDRQNHCILMRCYGHGDLDHWTVEKRFFLIKRNVMASCLALALIEDAMERNDYKELIARLDRLIPPTGDPAVDGCQPLLPPQELLDRKSKSEIRAEKEEKERQSLDGKVVWRDSKRKLYFEGDTPVLIYYGVRYRLSCEPHEPMLVIEGGNGDTVYVHNAFYPDECKGFIRDSNYLVGTITGRNHTAERFCRLLTAAIDSYADCQMNEVEVTMWEQLISEKGVGSIQFEARDFECEKELYEEIPLLLGYFESGLSRKHHVDKIYSIAFGYPGRRRSEYEYYLLSEQEHQEFMEWPEKQQWKDTSEASRWMHQNLEGKRQLLCNDFRKHPTIYKPFFTLSEIPGYGGSPLHTSKPTPPPPSKPTPPPPSKPTQNSPTVSKPIPPQKTITPSKSVNGVKIALSEDFNKKLPSHNNNEQMNSQLARLKITYTRESVCAADDYINGPLEIVLPDNATVGKLVDYIQHYHDGESYSAIPYTGGGNWWTLESDRGVLAQVNEDGNGVRYQMNPSTPLSDLGITKVEGKRG